MNRDNKKETILIFTGEYPPVFGGVASYAQGVARGLVAQGKEVTVLAPTVRNQTYTDKESPEIKIYRYINTWFIREMILLPYLIYIVLKRRIRRIYCIAWFPCGVITLFNWWLLRVPYAVKVSGADIFNRDISNSELRHRLKRKLFWLMRLVFKNARKILPNSNYSRGLLEEERAPMEKVQIVNPGVDASFLAPPGDTESVAQKFNLKGKDIILTVARLKDYKGQDMVIQALAKIIMQCPNAVYVIVGNGPDRERLNKIIDSPGLAQHVVFLKDLSQGEIVALYHLSTVYVMLSRQVEKRVEVEGFGIAFIEASACSKPVIGSTSGGVVDAVIDGVSGLTLDPLDVDTIAAALLRIIQDKEYAVALGRAGYERVKEHLTWPKVALKVWDAIENV